MSRREKLSKLSCVIEFFKIEQGLLQLINSRRREDPRSQQTKLLQHLCPRHGMLVASLGMENFLAIDLSIVFGSNIRVLAKNFFERIDRGVITAAAGVRLESDIERLKPFSEILSQVGEIRLVDESRAKPSVGSFQNIFDAGKPSGCK